MTTFQRIRIIIYGLMMIGGAVLIMLRQDVGLSAIVAIFSIALIVYGIRKIIYYIFMARHMVEGLSMLFLGVIILDVGIFTASVITASGIYIMLYLIVVHAFSGVIDILHAVESKKNRAHWKLNLVQGIINILITVACGIFIQSTEIAVYIFGAGLIYSGITRIISAFRRNAIIYIA